MHNKGKTDKLNISEGREKTKGRKGDYVGKETHTTKRQLGHLF